MAEEVCGDVIDQYVEAPTLQTLPQPIDVTTQTPPNPPEQIQLKFVGLSYRDAYVEAARFVAAADEFATTHRGAGLAALDNVVDFGSGWGRITRFLLTKLPPERIHALDVDPQMTALLHSTLPGVNAMTIALQPPTVLRDASMQAAVAFSVFSHLSGPAHEAWAAELGRVVAPGGVAAITVLDEAFLDDVARAQEAVAAGRADDFAAGLAQTFPDISAARRGFEDGAIQYAGVGGGEVRTGEYYGWAAAPPSYLDRVWGAAGFDVVQRVRAGALFPQSLVLLGRRADTPDTAGRPAAAGAPRRRGLLSRARAGGSPRG